MLASGWDYEVDVLVVGSGAGALTAAVRAADRGLSALVVEKTDLYGGTSAMSGGVVWLPASPLIAGAGGEDSVERACTYMKTVIDESSQETRIEAYVACTGKLTDFLAASTPVRLVPNPYYSDMYPDAPGAALQHRAHEPDPIDGALLGDEVHNLRRQHPQTTLFGFIGWTATDATVLQTRAPGWIKTAAGLMARYFLDLRWRFKTTRDRRQVLGGALVSGLRIAVQDRDIPLWLNSPMVGLIEEDGGVVGAVVRREGRELRVRAGGGVILASGGFEHSPEMRRNNLPGPTDTAWTTGSPGNTGEAIGLAQQLGADTCFMDEAWWGPTTVIPGESLARMLIIEKNLPGSMLVNVKGERFVNEGSSYTKVVKGMLKANRAGHETVPAYFVFDASYRHKFPCGPLYPGEFMPDWVLGKNLRTWLFKAATLDDLARNMGVDPAGLVDSASKMTDYARSGKDLDFARGDSVYDRMYGDRNTEPNPCLGPIDKPPFYGIKVYPGDLGTKGGVRTDESARVLKADGQIIDGLYATGNCAGSVMGRTYPASGSTLGPAMIFGLNAADHIAQRQ